MKKKEEITLTRDVTALLIPNGTPVDLEKGTEVNIAQDLGGIFTISFYGNLLRISRNDADVLGKKIIPYKDNFPPDTSLEEKIWSRLKACYDPEIPVNIVDLGLIYNIKIDLLENNKKHVDIVMTLTSFGCGMGPIIAQDAKEQILCISEIESVDVEIVFEPPWDKSMMTDTAKLTLGMM